MGVGVVERALVLVASQSRSERNSAPTLLRGGMWHAIIILTTLPHRLRGCLSSVAHHLRLAVSGNVEQPALSVTPCPLSTVTTHAKGLWVRPCLFAVVVTVRTSASLPCAMYS